MADPDYSPEFQDEYQRLWHRSRAEADTLAVALERARQAEIEALSECDRLRVERDKFDDEAERLGLRAAEAETDLARLRAELEEARGEVAAAQYIREGIRKDLEAQRDARPDLTQDEVKAAICSLDDAIVRYGCGKPYDTALAKLRALLDEGGEDAS